MSALLFNGVQFMRELHTAEEQGKSYDWTNIDTFNEDAVVKRRSSHYDNIRTDKKMRKRKHCMTHRRRRHRNRTQRRR